MRKIEFTTRFNRDFKREFKGQHGKTLDNNLRAAVALIASGIALPPNMRDHPLSGSWEDHRDCHLRPDLVLIYRFIGQDVVQFVRLGSHSELGL